MKRISTLVLLVVSTAICLGQTDEWIKINQGFAKCSNNGQASGEGIWYQDAFQIKKLAFPTKKMRFPHKKMRFP